MAKILKRLSLLPMSIEILKVSFVTHEVTVSVAERALQVTQIGKQVNGLRKWGGKVSSRAKSLVKKWKQLIPEAEDTQKKHAASPEVRSRLEASTSMEPRVGHEPRKLREGHELKEGHGPRMELGEGGGSMNSLRAEPVNLAGMRSGGAAGGGRSRLTVATAPVICIDSGDSEDSVVDITRATTSLQESKRNNHRRNKDKKRKKTAEHQTMDEFSRALEVPVLNRVTDSRHEVHPLSRDSRSQRESEQEDVLIVGQSYSPPVRREISPARPPHSSVGRKRKGVNLVCRCL